MKSIHQVLGDVLMCVYIYTYSLGKGGMRYVINELF